MQVAHPVPVVTATLPVVATNDQVETRKTSNGHIKPLKEEVLFSSKSLQLSQYTFEDSNGIEKSAEVIRKRFLVDGNRDTEDILSVAILRRHILCDCLILIKQYRPTLKCYVLEFPAKIIDVSEADKSGDLAKQDIEDSTGYRATAVQHISPETAMDPGKYYWQPLAPRALSIQILFFAFPLFVNRIVRQQNQTSLTGDRWR